MKAKEGPVIGNGNDPVNFILFADIMLFILFALEHTRLCNPTLTIGHPQNITFGELISVYSRSQAKSAQKAFLPLK